MIEILKSLETLVTTGQVVLAGEVKSEAYLDVQTIAREVINGIGYTKGEYMFNGDSCGVISAIHEQSSDINQGVDRKSGESFEEKSKCSRSRRPRNDVRLCNQ